MLTQDKLSQEKKEVGGLVSETEAVKLEQKPELGKNNLEKQK